MADFQDVVKQLKDNKISQDVGFNRLENAFSGGDPKSLIEEKNKNEEKIKNKEIGYFAGIASATSTSNDLLREGFKGMMDTKEGMLGGILTIMGAPLILLSAFFKELAFQVANLYKLFGKGLVKVFAPIKGLFNLLQKTFVGRLFTGQITAAGKVIDGIGDLFKSMTTAFKADFPKLIKSITSGNNPIGNIIKLFTAIGSAFTADILNPVKNSKLVKSVADTMKAITGGGTKGLNSLFTGLGNFFKSIGLVFKPLIDAVNGVVDLFFGGKGGAKRIKLISDVMSKLSSVFRVIGTLLAKIFLPITLVLGAIEVVTGIIDGYKKEGLIGGLEGGITNLFNFIVSAPLDMIKSLISWIAGKLGFSEVEKVLDNFSFTELFTTIIGSIFDGLKGAVAFIGQIFTFPKGGGILASFGSIIDILTIPIQTVFNFLRSMFGFDKDKDGKKLPPFSLGKFIVEIIENAIKAIKDFFGGLDFSNLFDVFSFMKPDKDFKVGEMKKSSKTFMQHLGFGGSDSSTANLSGIKKYDADEEAVIRDELDTSLSRLDSMRNQRNTRQYQNELKRVNLLKTELNQLSLLKKEQQNQAIKDSALNKGSSGNVTNIIDASTSAPTQNNNNTNSSTFSALGNLDPITRAAIASAT